MSALSNTVGDELGALASPRPSVLSPCSRTMTSFSFVSYLLLALLSSIVHAMPTKVVRDVVAPPITYPTAGVIWTAGSNEKVTWDASTIPSRDSGAIGMLILGWLDDTGENLQLDNPVEQNIPLVDGEVTITVPDVPERDNYILCLFGDSGDITEPFTIKGGQGSSFLLAFTKPKTSIEPHTTTGLRPSSTEIGSSTTYSSSPSTSPRSNTTTSGTHLPSSSGKFSGNTGAASAPFIPCNPLLSLLTISLVALFV